jgi:hypothetical protein
MEMQLMQPCQAPVPGYGAPLPAYGASSPAYGASPPAYCASPPAYGAPPQAYGASPPAYGASPPAYGAPPPGMLGHQNIANTNVTNTTVVNNVIGAPAVVGRGILWPALGNGQVCEVYNCGGIAYQVCNFTCKFGDISFTGCGRKMCMAHCKVTLDNAKNLQNHHEYNNAHATVAIDAYGRQVMV